MKTSTEVQASVLTALLGEDREEIRQIRSMIGKMVVFLTTASFGITAYLLGPELAEKARLFGLFTDITLAAFIWTLFCQLYLNLRVARQSLLMRQELLKALDEDRVADVNPFPASQNAIPDIKDTELFWLPGLATAAIAIKTLILFLP